MNTLIRDIRYALRTLARSPGFTAVAILTIGIGIGASTTIFSWMRSLMLNPLPGATQADRIVALENTAADGIELGCIPAGAIRGDIGSGMEHDG